MKQALIFIFFSFIIKNAFAQDKKYDSLWAKVERLSSSQGLTTSALAEVKKIYMLAKKENNQAQLIKSLVYQVDLQEQYQENAVVKSITELEAELKTMKEPALSILNSVLAEKYWMYFQQHRWQLYERTETNLSNEIMETWTVTQFHKRITALYLASVKNASLLQQVTLDKFEAVILEGNTRKLRPTLFDLLAHRAITYFRNEERDIIRPAYAFYINDPAAFADAADFSKYSFKTSDSLSSQHKAIQLYQRLLAFHAADKDPDASIDADVNRLQFARQYAQLENKDSLYLEALQRLTKKFPGYKTGASAYLLIAQWYMQRASKFEAGKDTSYQYDYLKAKAIAENIIAENTNNAFSTAGLEILNNILRKNLQLQTEKINIPGKPFRTLVNFRNIDKLALRLVRLSDAMKNELAERYDDKYWQQLTTLPAYRDWSQPLPVTNDHQQHAVEIKIDELPVGNYLLLASSDENISLKANVIAAQFFYVSNISYISNRTEYFVLHRETGKPLANAAIQVWTRQYDYTTRKNVLKAAEKLKADEHGFFRMKERPRGNADLRFEFTYRDDRLFDDEYQYGIFRDRTAPAVASAEAYERANARIFFFTDRSIYRPGQKVYFKGIALTRDFTTRKNKILPAFHTTIKLYNTNGEVVDSVNVTTNEFGSYNGSFQLPENTLNGSFRLRDDQLNSEVYFSVEEYKRPKFYIDYEPLKGTYRLNDSILVTGLAKAYAGNNLSGAVVNYSIVREARFPYPWLYWKWGYLTSSRMEIAQGVVRTDADGKFAIRFKSIPDRSVNSAMEPVFQFKIVSNITDINGETRTGETIIPVSYKALLLEIDLLPEVAIPVDSFKKITVLSKNLNGQHQPSGVRLQVYRLQPPGRMIKSRLWPKPDLFLMDKDVFASYFPNDEYQDEYNVHSWAKSAKIYDAEDSSGAGHPFILNDSFKEGWYIVEAVTKDKYGQEVKDIRYVQLYAPGNTDVPLPLYIWNMQKADSTEPGGKTLVGIGSAAADLFVIQHTDREISNDEYPAVDEQRQIPEYRFISLDKERKWFDIPVDENDRGGFGVHHFFVKDNRFYIASNRIDVPWSDKELTISYESFRDKTLPGSDEKWKLKISGNKGRKVAAELLVSMYDASLDQFQPHQWIKPGIWPNYYNYNPWNSSASFREVSSQEKYVEKGIGIGYYKTYDRLLTSVYGSSGNVRGYATEKAMERRGVPAPAMAEVSVVQDAKVGNQNLQDSTALTSDVKQQTVDNNLPIQSRTNFNESAFFIPDLKTDADGNIEFNFTIPESLTRWKFQAFSHTKDLAFGISTKEVITQKELMVQPNAPRFLREGDRLELSTKIVNLTGKEITGTVQLELFNAATMQPVDGWFQNAIPNQYFTVDAGQSAAAAFRIEVPYQFNSAVVYRFTARSTQVSNGITLSDGEEAALPVVANTMLVTETKLLPVQGSQVKKFSFEKLLNAGYSETLKHHAVTIEFTSNPAWYAVQALPYLAEPAVESADHLFNRYYANALAFRIANSSPRIREIFQKWKNADTAALLSNLQKNPDLKAVLLQETPWVLQAKTESEQKKNVALLFDMVNMSKNLGSAITHLKEMQSPNGGFMWFKGGPDDRYITQYILTGIGHLKKLDAIPASSVAALNDIIKPAIKYLDERITDDYSRLLKQKKPELDKNHLNYLHVQFLYMRRFFNDYAIPGASFAAVKYYRKQSQQFWVAQNKYMQGMIALSLFRTGDKIKAKEIVQSLKENSLYDEEMGRYWRQHTAGYFWYQAPVETQSLLIEAFTEIAMDMKTVNEMKTWLLKQKQTRNWKTNKATADACYALLMSAGISGSDASWINQTPQVNIQLGDKLIRSSDEKTEAGTGYFKRTIEAPFIKPELGNISVNVTGATDMPSWGAVYWQYFERLDKITSAASPLKIQKQLFREKITDRGPLLEAVTEGKTLATGDKIKVRIVVTSDRDMEYIHLKDMRASCMEPVNVISGYKWQGGVGYYESTKDASTSFFFSWLPKGTYVFEYPVFVTHSGNFSNGITSIQSLYAPEFASHSEGVRVVVE